MPPPYPWTPTSLDAGEVTALAAAGDRVLAAVCDRGRSCLYRSDDAGRTWAPTRGLPTDMPILALTLSQDASTAVAGPYASGIFWSRDGGHSWAAAGGAGVAPITALALETQPPFTFAGTLRRGVLRSADGGLTWAPASAGLPAYGRLEVMALAAVPTGLIASHAYGLHLSADGQRWAPAGVGLPAHPLPDLFTLSAGPASAVSRAVASSAAGLFYSDEPIASWTKAGGGGHRLLATDRDVLYAVADEASLQRSVDGGITWARLPETLPAGTCPMVAVVAGRTDRRVLLLGTADAGVLRRTLERRSLERRPLERQSSFAAGVPRLEQNVPNPFSDATTIPFALVRSGRVRLSIYDAAGDEVSVLVDGTRSAGSHAALLGGSTLGPGPYRYRLATDSAVLERTMLLLKRV